MRVVRKGRQLLKKKSVPPAGKIMAIGYIQLYSPIYMVAEIRKTTEKKKERNLAIAPMTSIP